MDSYLAWLEYASFLHHRNCVERCKDRPVKNYTLTTYGRDGTVERVEAIPCELEYHTARMNESKAEYERLTNNSLLAA